MVPLPMFPLGSVLFPSVYLPLHVFEPRYRELTRDCLDGNREFGVVLIERGSEVGGADVRTDIGTVARIVEAAELDDGRWVLGAVGTRRIRVSRWLEDNPYPRAEVEDWDDLGDDQTDEDGRLGEVKNRLRRVLGLAAEVGGSMVPATAELSDDPALASYQMAAVGPLGPHDQLKVLSTATTGDRLDLLGRLLEEEAEVLEARLRF